jgi:hypothetical protein
LAYRSTIDQQSTRNFLTEKEFAEVKARDPNYAGYLDLDYLLNPTKRPSQYLWFNDIYDIGLALYAGTVYMA